MIGVHTKSKTGKGQRPVFQGVNWDSPQAEGLQNWYPMHCQHHDVLVDVIAGDDIGGGSAVDSASWAGAIDFDKGMGSPLFTPDATAFEWYHKSSSYTYPGGDVPHTIMGWCQWTNADQNPGGIIGYAGSDNQQKLLIRQQTNTFANPLRSSFVYDHTNVLQWDIASPPIPSNWHHVIGSSKGTSHYELIVDGVSRATDTSGTANPSAPDRKCIGASAIYTGNYGYHGSICDVRQYTRYISEDEAAEMYDPATRWDLYWQPSRKAYFVAGAAAAEVFEAAWGTKQVLPEKPAPKMVPY